MVCNLVGTVEILFSETSGKACIDTDTGAGCHSDHQVLCRECQRNSSQCIFADLCYEHAVDDIVKCLDQHRYNHRKRHG